MPLTVYCGSFLPSIVKPGVRFREIGEIISRHASMSGFSVVNEFILFRYLIIFYDALAFLIFMLSCLMLQVKSYCGHGIGELFHCAPNIPHYARILKG